MRRDGATPAPPICANAMACPLDAAFWRELLACEVHTYAMTRLCMCYMSQAPDVVAQAGPGGVPPARYSWIGTFPTDHAFNTGSMMRQASSASSPAMNNIGSPLSISWTRWAYAVNRGGVVRASSSRS